MNRRGRWLITLLLLFAFAFQSLPALAQSGADVSPDDFITQLDGLRAGIPTLSESFRVANPDWETDDTDDTYSIDFTNRMYRITSTDANQVVWGSSPAEASNFYVEVYGDRVSGPAKNEFGIMFRYQDAQNFYNFMISSDGYYVLRKLENDEWGELIAWTTSDAIDQSDGASNLLGVYADGPTIVLLINDQVVARMDDETFTSGGMALAAGSFDEGAVAIAFDDFAMWDLDVAGALDLPAIAPSDTPTAEATPEATTEPTAEPTAEPPTEPTVEPTAEPTTEPTVEPTAEATPLAETDSAAILDRADTIREGAATLSEDFSRDKGAWPLGNDGSSDIKIARRALSINVIDPNWLAWSNLKDVQAGDLLMEADLRLDKGPTATEAGLIFRFVDKDNFYYFATDAQGSYSLWKLVDNKWDALLPWTASDAVDTTEGAVNRLSVLAEGDTFSVLINDTPVAQAQDATFSAGQVGLGVGTFDKGDATIIADNVDLWVISEGISATATPEIAVPLEPTATPKARATPEAAATPQADQPAPPPAKDAGTRLDTVRAADPTATSDFRRDDGSWSMGTEDHVTQAYVRRAYHITVDRTDWLSWTTNDNLTATDFLAEVDAAYIAGPQTGEYGFVFRHKDDNNFYLYAITAEGHYALLKRQAGEWHTLLDWTKSDALNTGTSALNRIGVLAEGDQITLFANSTPLTTVTDDAFAGGNIALAAGTFSDPGLEVSFDNFSYWDTSTGG